MANEPAHGTQTGAFDGLEDYTSDNQSVRERRIFEASALDLWGFREPCCKDNSGILWSDDIPSRHPERDFSCVPGHPSVGIRMDMRQEVQWALRAKHGICYLVVDIVNKISLFL
jgi:hypothetical protein